MDILETDAEHEVLARRLVEEVVRSLRGILREPPADDVIYQHAQVAVTAIARRLRVMSARQVAVWLADEANRHETWKIQEPPEYSAEELTAVQ